MRSELSNEQIPYFAWDRTWTAGEIRTRLQQANALEWPRIAAWIMREAAMQDVWQFLTPRQVADRFAELAPLLGRRSRFWKYILQTWHELGRL